MNGFNDKGLQKIWDGLGLPADIRMQEDFEQMVCEWKEADIVMCKDCKFYVEDYWGQFFSYPLCELFKYRDGGYFEPEPHGFCSSGVKRND